MKDKYKIEGQRLEELPELQRRITKFLKSETERKRAVEAAKLAGIR